MRLSSKFKLGCVGSLLAGIIGWIILTADYGYGDGWLQLGVFLRECSTDELRIEHFAESSMDFHWTDADYEAFIVNLSTGKTTQTTYRSIPFTGFNSMGPFMLAAALPESMDKGRLEEIQQTLLHLEPGARSYDSYRYQVHLSFWRDGHLCIYSYDRADRRQIQALAAELGLSPDHFNARSLQQ